MGKNVEKCQKITKKREMFYGSYTYSIDPKNRLSIPVKFRRNLNPESGDTFMMTRGIQQCVYVYPKDLWEKDVEPRIKNLDEFDTQQSSFMCLLLEYANEDVLDSQSRLLIPKALTDFAGIEKDVFILGVRNHLELWNPQVYQQFKASITKSYAEIAAEVMKKE